jgi:hypothetical protein
MSWEQRKNSMWNQQVLDACPALGSMLALSVVSKGDIARSPHRLQSHWDRGQVGRVLCKHSAWDVIYSGLRVSWGRRYECGMCEGCMLCGKALALDSKPHGCNSRNIIQEPSMCKILCYNPSDRKTVTHVYKLNTYYINYEIDCCYA